MVKTHLLLNRDLKAGESKSESSAPICAINTSITGVAKRNGIRRILRTESVCIAATLFNQPDGSRAVVTYRNTAQVIVVNVKAHTETVRLFCIIG